MAKEKNNNRRDDVEEDTPAPKKMGGSNDDNAPNISPNPKSDDIWQEPWFLAYWRPAAAWTYLVICVFDFLMAPIFMGWYAIFTKSAYIMWAPLTLQGGGLFHLAFGAILGIYVYGRTREKLAGAIR